jgi:hypothetical protein
MMLAIPDPDLLSFALNRNDFATWINSAYPPEMQTANADNAVQTDIATSLAEISYTLKLLAYLQAPKHLFSSGSVESSKSSLLPSSRLEPIAPTAETMGGNRAHDSE